MVFCLQREGIRLAEGGVFGLPSPGFKGRLASLEPAYEFDLGGAKHVFRVELEMAGEVGNREDEIAKFLRTLGGLS